MHRTYSFSPKFKIIVAYLESNRVIGDSDTNNLVWPILKPDLRHFVQVTSNVHGINDGAAINKNAVVMGRKTWESLPQKSRPLKNRINIVITRDKSYTVPDGVHVVYDVKDAIMLGYLMTQNDADVFVVGGGEIYKQALALGGCTQIYASEITPPNNPGESATWIHFPEIKKHEWHRQVARTVKDGDYSIKFVEYHRNDVIRPGRCYGVDEQYLRILRTVLKTGVEKPDRTGVGTISSFGQMLKWDFRPDTKRPGYYTFPLMTTKRMATKSIIEELLFFLRGEVDNDILSAKGVPIWNGNTTREFLDNRGLTHMETGALGKAYGFQWRHWGAEWQGKSHDYKSDPNRHDQIAEILNTLKTNPTSRRIVLSAWNVGDLDEMCLPPCHTMYVFNVQYKNDKPYLYCHMTQRSADMFLGVPFNIASTALLTMILAKAANMEPGGIAISFVDAHIYKNHVDQVEKQLARDSFQPPVLSINKTIENINDIENLQFEDFKLLDYYRHPGIKAPMAV